MPHLLRYPSTKRLIVYRMSTHWASASSEYSKVEHTASATTAQYFKAAAIAVASAAEKYFQLLTVQSPDT